uniref:Caspase n=1 Tax=Strigamia maritima TaxID=126957 RepID=T1J3Q5_STRMM
MKRSVKFKVFFTSFSRLDDALKMDREYRKKIIGRLSLLVENVINFDQLLERALKSKLVTQKTINEWQLTYGGPGTIGKLTGPLLKSNNHDILDILHDDYIDSEQLQPITIPTPHSGEKDEKEFKEKYIFELEEIREVRVKPARQRYGGKNFNRHDFYTMESKPRGFALIVVNELFQDPKNNRLGAAKDFDLMQKLLRQLGFQVFPHQNKTKQQIEHIVDEFTKQPELENVNSCVVAISSHGVKDGFCGTGLHDQVYAIETLKTKFNNSNCQALNGKPKIFFIQACRGSYRDMGAPVDRHDDPASQVDYNARIGDIFVEYSCQPGYLSKRNEGYGSWLFYMVVKVFMENAWQDDLTELIRKVHTEIAQLKSTNQGEKQAAEWYVNGLWKQLYFNPGL